MADVACLYNKISTSIQRIGFLSWVANYETMPAENEWSEKDEPLCNRIVKDVNDAHKP